MTGLPWIANRLKLKQGIYSALPAADRMEWVADLSKEEPRDRLKFEAKKIRDAMKLIQEALDEYDADEREGNTDGAA